jgi:hypothetical protein
MKKFSLDGSTAAERRTLAPLRENISATWKAGTVRLTGVEENSRVRVLDITGRVVLAAPLSNHQFTFAGRPGGVYLVAAGTEKRTVAVRIALP